MSFEKIIFTAQQNGNIFKFYHDTAAILSIFACCGAATFWLLDRNKYLPLMALLYLQKSEIIASLVTHNCLKRYKVGCVVAF